MKSRALLHWRAYALHAKRTQCRRFFPVFLHVKQVICVSVELLTPARSYTHVDQTNYAPLFVLYLLVINSLKQKRPKGAHFCIARARVLCREIAATLHDIRTYFQPHSHCFVDEKNFLTSANTLRMFHYVNTDQ